MRSAFFVNQRCLFIRSHRFDLLSLAIAVTTCVALTPVDSIAKDEIDFPPGTFSVDFNYVQEMGGGGACGGSNVVLQQWRHEVGTFFDRCPDQTDCTYCSCRMSAGGHVQGLARITLYVDPNDHRVPLPQSQGGVPLNEVPLGSRLSHVCLRASAGANAYWGAYGFTYSALAGAQFQNLLVVSANNQNGMVYPYCDFGQLNGALVPYTVFASAIGQNCTNANSEVEVSPLLSHLYLARPPSALESTQGESGAMPTRFVMRNTSPQSWYDLRCDIFCADDRRDSLLVPALLSGQRLVWVVDGYASDSAFGFTAFAEGAKVHPVMNRGIYINGSPGPQYFTVNDSLGNGTSLPIFMDRGAAVYWKAGEFEVTLSVPDTTGFRVEAGPPAAYCVSDDFSQVTLDSCWYAVVPDIPGSRITTDERPGFARIVAGYANGGACYDSTVNYMAPRMIQSVSGDWALTTKLCFNPTDEFEMAGILVDGEWVASRAYINPVYVGYAQVIGCVGSFVAFDGDEVLFRVISHGGTLEVYWSSDGAIWHYGGAKHAQPQTVSLFCARRDNGDNDPHDSIADFDYVHFTPISETPANFALAFDGVDDVVATQDTVMTANDFTMELWVNPVAAHQIDPQSTAGVGGTSGQRYAIGPPWGGIYDPQQFNAAGAGVSVGTNGVSVYEHSANYMPATLVWGGSLSGWTHVAVVYTNKTPSLYINGQWVKTGLRSPKANVYPGPLLDSGIGGRYYGYYLGLIDEVRIWGYARTAVQIASTMNTELTIDDLADPGLVDYWRMNEGSGQVVANSVRAENGGVLGTTGSREDSDPMWTVGAAPVEQTPTAVNDNGGVGMRLKASYPNPFNSTTTIAYVLVRPGAVNLTIYDAAGRRVRVLVNGDSLEAGEHEVAWNGRDDSGRIVASGSYFYRLRAGSELTTGRMAFVK